MNSLITTSLQDFIKFVDRRIVAIFKSTGVLYPMWHAITETGDHRIVTPPGDKDTASALMRAYFDLNDVVRYVFVDEAWTFMAPADISPTELNRIMKAGLEDHPGRVEVVMYQAEDARAGSATAHRVIVRPSRGKPVLGPLSFFETTQSEGRFVGMLPQRGTVQ